MKAEPSGRILK